jgi:hypothetical protein
MTGFGWYCNELCGKLANVYYMRFGRYYRKKYAARKLHGAQQGNDMIRVAIEKNIPFVASRIGYNEMTSLSNCEGARLGLREYDINGNANLCGSAGFFPDTKEAYDRYYQWHTENIRDIDLLAVWFNAHEDYMIKKYMPDTNLAYPRCLEPYYHEEPWTAALEGKRVLVVSPFVRTMETQYVKREKLFDDHRLLPEFELKTIKAVQSLGGDGCGYKDWFEALESMRASMENTEFDVALLGCGAYGLPLAVEAKRMGKQAVHVGGALQIMFGIKGKRWDDHEVIGKLYNEYWVRPSDEEKPAAAGSIEDGCYW